MQHPVNAGYGASIKTALLQARYPWVGIIDADGSYEIEAVPRLIRASELGFDMVVGERENIQETDSFVQNTSRRLFNYFVRLVIGANIKDPNSGLRIMRKAAVMEFFPFLCSSFSFTTGLTALFAERGLFIKYVKTTYKHRSGKSKVRHIRDSIRALQMIVQGITYFNPVNFLQKRRKDGGRFSIFFILFVCIPAMILAMFGMHTLSLYYMLFGVVTVLLMSIGILGDIVRVSAAKTNPGDSKISNDDESFS